MYGPSLTGKTTWAQSLGPHLYMRKTFNAKQAALAESASYAIIDDISGGIRFFPHWKDWLGGQPYVQVRQLYKDELLLKWGKPTIWLANRDLRDELADMVGRDYSNEAMLTDIAYLETNCIFVHVTSNIVAFS